MHSAAPTASLLVTLGRLALLSPDGSEEESLRKRRRKIAVLAVLALERRPLSRDVLVEMFWGDQEETRARHSLSDALSHIRRILGRDAISIGRSEVALARDAPLAVDAAEFAAAVKKAEYERALELYGGDFLEAVYVGGSTSFEHWVERHRASLHELFLKACREQCARLKRAGRLEECAPVAARWLDAEPLSEDAALYRLEALEAAGTSDAVLAARDEYQRLRARLSREFQLAPGTRVAALGADLDVRVASRPAAPPPAPAPAPSPPPAAAPNVAVPIRQPRRRWRAPFAILAVAIVLGVAALGIFADRQEASEPLSANTVAVMPFSVRGGNDVDYLAHGMVDLLSTNFDGAGTLRVVDPRALLSESAKHDSASLTTLAGARALASRFGAALVVLGEAVVAGDRLRLTAALYDQRRGASALSRGTVEGRSADIFALVDGLTRQLLAGYPDQSPDRLTGLAAHTTTSLPALKAYLEGVSHYRASRYEAALAAFERAAAGDSTFALAHYQLSNTALWAAQGGWDSVINTSSRAVRFGGRLTRRARFLVEAYEAFRTGHLDRSEAQYRYLVANYPDEVEGWYQLGDLLYHGNPPRGRSFAESRQAFEHVLVLEPEHRGAMLHLMRIAMWERKATEVDSLIRLLLPRTQPSEVPELEAERAFALGDTAAQRAALARLRGAHDEIVRVAAMRVALYARDLDGAERISRLLLEPKRAPEFRAVGHLHLADLAVARGRWREALHHVDSIAPIVPVLALESRARILGLPFVPAPREVLEAARDTLERWDGTAPLSTFPMFAVFNGLHEHLRLYYLALLRVRLGDFEGAERAARRLATLRGAAGAAEREARELARGLSESVRGHVLAARGEREAALERFERGRLTITEGLLDSPIGSQALERYVRGELLRSLGQTAEARRWHGSLGQTAIDQVDFAHVLEGRR
ncbi:MAG TPA: BTAD domain-containing putative transcriptional regulator [Gemmatimonadaceae bacterium]|nr:BTAD domain-containing putative transcriptional regulator [Gemmatimonadaceae bacterium]